MMAAHMYPGLTILVLTAGGFNSWMIANHLAARFAFVRVIQENPESKRVLFARRRRIFGLAGALGQLATMIVSRLGKSLAKGRIEQIAAEQALDGEPDSRIPVHRVESLNDPATRALIADLKPSAIVTVSCRILSNATLSALPCPVINLHSGITPAYRGQMGGYWAMVSGDSANFGATVHLVDAGVDTGDVLYQVRTRPTRADSMLTYPTLLTAISADSVAKAVSDVLDGTLAPRPAEGPSRLWYNVPVWTWLYHGLTKRIW